MAADAAARWRLAQQVFSARLALSLPAVLLAFVAVGWAAPGAAPPLGDALAIAALACALGWPATWYLQATQQLNRWSRVEVGVYAALIAACWAFATSVLAFVVLQLAASALLAVLGWRWLVADLAEVRQGEALFDRAAAAARAFASAGRCCRCRSPGPPTRWRCRRPRRRS